MCNLILTVQRLDGSLASSGEETNFILLTGIWVVIALALYFMRPNPARKRDVTIKNLPGGSGNSGSDVRTKLKYISYHLVHKLNHVFIFRILLLLRQWELNEDKLF